jgi:hypothetical protein
MTKTGEKTSVAILSSASGGGAGIAAKRMANALDAEDDFSVDFVEGKKLGELLPQSVSPQDNLSNRTISDTHYTLEYPGFSRGWLVNLLRGYDVVNVHWATFLIGLAELDAVSRAGKPMLFMMHDFHYITGGCHYPATCQQLKRGCVACPQLDRRRAPLSVIPRNLQIKAEILSRPNVHMMTPSHYLADTAVATGIIPASRMHVLRNPYEPLREPTDFSSAGPIRILLIADSLAEGRKNMRLALDSLATFMRESVAQGLNVDVMVDLVGQSNDELVQRLKRGGIPHKLHGRVTDHAVLTEILSESDIMLTCSNEDNWPNILVESGSYGCIPVVGPGHGCEEFVRRYNFGAIARDYSVPAFVEGLFGAIGQLDANRRRQALDQIREDHKPSLAAIRFREIIEHVLAASRARS